MSKKKSFLAAVIISCISATAFAETIGDTIVIEKADKVKIETRDTVQRIVITGSKDDPQFHYTQRISMAYCSLASPVSFSAQSGSCSGRKVSSRFSFPRSSLPVMKFSHSMDRK